MSENLSVYTFGGLSIHRDGKPVPSLHSRKAQALLVHLAVTARPQPRELLADLLWEEFSQKKAMNNLRVVLSNLRKHMGGHLLITRDTAAMNPGVDYELDVAVLDSSLGLAREYERRTGTLNREAVAQIELAIELYKGEFLVGFFVEKAQEFDAWMVVERERLHHIMLDGLGKLVRWELTQGEHTDGIRHASRWVQLDPLSETAHRQMMRLLAYNGQRSAALAQYARFREIFADELGVEPDRRTTALYDQIREGALTPDETISQPIPTPEPVNRDIRRHNLPVQTTPFIGREQELAELDQLLRDPEVRLVTVMGAGGMGKTRLVQEAGESMLDPFSDGVYLVPLAGLRSADRIVPSIIQTLEIEIARGGAGGSDSQMDLKESLLRNLRRKQMLLILDNFEHLLDGVTLVSEILQSALDVKILTTSRVRLNIGGEHRFQVGGMAYPEDIEDDEAQKYSAVRLFLESARRAWSGFRLRPDEMQHIAKICRLVEGMPLGVRLAAAWVGTLSPEEIATEITKDLDVLETDLRDIPARHRSIRALYDHTWSLLSEREREVFQAFSVFRGGCDREAAGQVTGATLRDLRSFGDKSLLNRTLMGRYELHELSREYAAGKLGENPESKESVHSRHSAYYCDAVKEWEDDLKSTQHEIALTEMDLEIDNVLAAWHWAVGRRRVDLLDQSMESLRYYFEIRIRWPESERTFRQAVESLKSKISEDELRVYARLISMHAYFFSDGNLRKQDLYQQSLGILEKIEVKGQDVRYEKAQILNFLGFVAASSDFEQAIHFHQASLALFKELGDRYWIAQTYYGLGDAFYVWGKMDDAEKYFQESMVVYKELGDRRQIANILRELGLIYKRQGKFAKAERFARERLEIYERIGDPSAIANGQAELGICQKYLGEFDKAETLLENTLAVYKELENYGYYYFSGINTLCLIKLDLGKYMEAYDLAQSFLDTTSAMQYASSNREGRDTKKRRLGYALTIQGMASLALGTVSEAEDLLQQSIEALRETHLVSYSVYYHFVLGIVLLKLNQPDRAKEHIYDSLQKGVQISSALVQLPTLGAAALYLADQGGLEHAVEIYALASRYPWIAKSKWYQDVIETPLSTLTASLSPEIIAAVQKRGRKRDLEETVQELLVELREEK